MVFGEGRSQCFIFYIIFCIDRSLKLLQNIKSAVGAEAFFSCLWEAALGSPSVRLPALIFVNTCFDRRKSMEDQLFIMGYHVDHMVEFQCS